MTLTDILPSMRRSLPDPLDLDAWPADTRATVRDVLVGGASMADAARASGTPHVHPAVACVRRSQGTRVAPDRMTTVVVARVLAVAHHPGGALLLHLDADLGRVPAVLAETRLVGRVSTAHDAPAYLVRDAAGSEGVPFLRLESGLPADLAAGDLLALPVDGPVRREDIAAPD